MRGPSPNGVFEAIRAGGPSVREGGVATGFGGGIIATDSGFRGGREATSTRGRSADRGGYVTPGARASGGEGRAASVAGGSGVVTTSGLGRETTVMRPGSIGAEGLLTNGVTLP